MLGLQRRLRNLKNQELRLKFRPEMKSYDRTDKLKLSADITLDAYLDISPELRTEWDLIFKCTKSALPDKSIYYIRAFIWLEENL